MQAFLIDSVHIHDSIIIIDFLHMLYYRRLPLSYWDNIRLILRICLRRRIVLILVIAIAVLGFNILDLAMPKALQLLVASLNNHKLSVLGISLENLITKENRIIFFTLILPVLALLKWVVGYFRGVWEAKLGQGALYDLRNKIFSKVQSLSFAYHDQTHSGRFIANIVEDVGQVSMFFERPFFMILQVLAGLSCIYAFMFTVCWQAATVSLAIMLLFLSTTLLFRRFGYPVYLHARASLETMVSSFSENMEGNLLIRSFGRQEQERDKFADAANDYHNAVMHSRVLWNLLNQSLLWGVFLGIPAVVYVTLKLLQQGQFSSDNIFLIFMLQTAMVMQMRILSRTVDRGVHFSVSAQRLGGLFHVEDYLPDVSDLTTLTGSNDPHPSCLVDLPHGTLELSDVNFAYRGSTAGVNGISMKIEEGQTIGLVGETGSGKSTLALLMCRFYDPDSGSITIGGEDIRHMPVAQLREEFALVFQDTFLFSASIKENISYGKSSASEDEIINAAKLAKSHDFIMEFPEGYDTIVGERGVTLSGGQRQRIAIARAILREPRFLVLDDATSSLDMATEKTIEKSINDLPRSITRIIIAHRFSSIERADMVYVLSDGRVLEQGTPRTLNRPGTEMSRILQLSEDEDKKNNSREDFPSPECGQVGPNDIINC